jgi:hypothetical protein
MNKAASSLLEVIFMNSVADDSHEYCISNPRGDVHENNGASSLLEVIFMNNAASSF